jgi:hypothetical protein
MKKVIFISGAYRNGTEWGLEENIRRAEDAALKLWKLGWVVICPHKNSAHFGGSCPDKVWLDGDLELLRRSDAIYLLKGWQKSEGALMEYELATKQPIKIYEEEFTPYPRP